MLVELNIRDVEVQMMPPSIAVVAADIDTEERRQAFRKYMDSLDAIERTDMVFDFVIRDTGIKWDVIYEKMKEIMDLKEDVIFIWDMARPKGEVERQMFMTKIG